MEGTTSAISSSGVPLAASSRISSETSSSERARPCGFEEADSAVEGRTGRRRVGEEMPLQVRERRMSVLRGSGRKLLDLSTGERGEVLLRASQRCEGSATGLVRQRNRHLCAARQRLEQPPLRAGQILEPVREDRSAVPRIELRAKPLDRTAPKQIAVPEAEAIELRSIGGVQQPEISVQLFRLEEAGLELRERGQERVGEARKPRRPAEAIQRGSCEDPPRNEGALCIGRDGSGIRCTERELAKDVVERADRACEQGTGAPQQVAFDPVDVRPVRHDEDRIAVDRREVPLEETRDLAGFRRPDDESQAHLPMVVRASDAPADEISGKSGVSPALSHLSGHVWRLLRR